MRILVATDQWWPDFAGGSARVAGGTAHRLAERGHTVVVLAPGRSGTETLVDGHLVVRRELRRSALPQTLTDVWMTARAARRLRGERFDVALAHQATTATGLRLSGLDAPLALVFHASARRELQFQRSRDAHIRAKVLTYALEQPLRVFERGALRSAASVLVLSEFSRSLVLADRPGVASRIRRVSGGVDMERFSPAADRAAIRSRLGVEATTPLLLTVRRLDARMGLENLLQALVDVPATARLVVVGVGPLDPALRGLAARLGVADRVRFVGRVSDDELVDWYRAADTFVLPTVAYEGFGMATVEALACGTPVVGTPVGATPELLDPLDSRLVTRGTAPGDLAVGIRETLALASPALAARCRAYAVDRYSWDVAIDAWEQALRASCETQTSARGSLADVAGEPARPAG